MRPATIGLLTTLGAVGLLLLIGLMVVMLA
jgi:hypothetical protein